MKLSLNGLVIEADAEKTKRFCAEADYITDSCSCGGCRNYALAAERFPSKVREFFGNLGIDPRKPAEVYLLSGENGGDTARYGGFYHLCGKLLDGERDAIDFYTVAEGYSVAFTENISLPEDNLPEPALQMEIDFTVPRLLS